LGTARALLDFTGGTLEGVVSQAVADEQLRGAVAVHNLLQDHGVAYLADEVGMGKTYVALGAMALLRHFQPDLRVLVIAPRQNIQDKWIKDWGNFVQAVVKVEDLRVKALGGAPARTLVKVNSLVDLAVHASRDPDRDFIMRLTSFSIPVTRAGGTMDARRKQLCSVLPWFPTDLLDARDKERYKRNFARAINCALPDFDLVIVDEGHNLKAGWSEGKSSIRNTVLACALGGRNLNDEHHPKFKGYRRRLNKVLFLSATPIEHDFHQLWNQLDLLGAGKKWETIKDKHTSDDVRVAAVRELLIRRTVTLVANTKPLTKTEYRREWRGGGVEAFDEELRIDSDRQRLAVALMQKKVTEVMESGEQKHSFQVGLLASFESYLATAKVKPQGAPQPVEGEEDNDDGGTFHRTPEEIAAGKGGPRHGADIDAINGISRHYYRTFRRELPHPKMDALARVLSESFTTGRKALVFVRRVASVDELQRKLEEAYDQSLFTKLRNSARSPQLRGQINDQVEAYTKEREKRRHDIRARDAGDHVTVERSTVDSFFAWFFRGDGPSGVRSGASIATDLDKPSSSYSTLLEDHYVAAVLRTTPADVPVVLSGHLNINVGELFERIATSASQFLDGNIQPRRRKQYRACQIATLQMIRDQLRGSRESEEAELFLDLIYPFDRGSAQESRFRVDAEQWLTEETFFSALRSRPGLATALWPTDGGASPEDRLRKHEQRRVLISTMLRKGHPIIDLFILIANRLGTIGKGSQELAEAGSSTLASELCEMLEEQSKLGPDVFSAFSELQTAADCFDLLMRLNAPDALGGAIDDLPRLFGTLLTAQRPVAGMAGKVNSLLVRQFRMPGYPLVLITTDLLKEGEDLHTFCSSVHHYGIAWMPSELEQRVGRIDRVGSQTERRLADLIRDPDGTDKLQVFYPHLRDTVEVAQVNRVFERLNTFLRMLHLGLTPPPRESAFVDIAVESLRQYRDVAPIREPLRSAFPVTDEMVSGEDIPLEVSGEVAESMRRRFLALADSLPRLGAKYVTVSRTNHIMGEFDLGHRVQPFVVFLRSLHGRPMVRCISPIGRTVEEHEWDEPDDAAAARIVTAPFTRLSIVADPKFDSYDVAVEGDLLLGSEAADRRRFEVMMRSVLQTADSAEHELFHKDDRLEKVRSDLDREGSVAR
jgi:hypothetical protein